MKVELLTIPQKAIQKLSGQKQAYNQVQNEKESNY